MPIDSEDAMSLVRLSETDRIMIAAHAALTGWHQEPERALIELFRSDAPIEPHIRELLARALGNDSGTGMKLAFVKRKKARERLAANRSRKKWIKVGRWIREAIGSGRTRTDAIDLASEKFHFSREGCDKALIYYDRIVSWSNVFIQENPEAWATVQGVGGMEYLEYMFRIRDAAGEPLDKRANPFEWPL